MTDNQHSELAETVRTALTFLRDKTNQSRQRRAFGDDALAALDSLVEQLEAAQRTLRYIAEIEATGDLKSNMARQALNPAINPNIEPGCCGQCGPRGCGDIEPFDQEESSPACKHPDVNFDRSLCACGSMHYYCVECGLQADACSPASERSYDERMSELDVAGAESGWTGAPNQDRERS